MLGFFTAAPFHPYKVAAVSCTTLLLVELAWRKRCSPLTPGGEAIHWYQHRFWRKHYWWFYLSFMWFVLLPIATPDDRSWSEIFKQLDPVNPSYAGKVLAWAIGSTVPLVMLVLPFAAEMLTLGSYVVGVSSNEILLVPVPPWRVRVYRRQDVVAVTERVPAISIGRFETGWHTRVRMRDGCVFGLAPLTSDSQGLLAAFKASVSPG